MRSSSELNKDLSSLMQILFRNRPISLSGAKPNKAFVAPFAQMIMPLWLTSSSASAEQNANANSRPAS
jgi:hypothetical protein